MFAGQVMTGASPSLTATVWVQVAAFPELSVAVQVIVVVPTGWGSFSGLPSLRAPPTVTPEQLSVAVAVPGFTVAAHWPGSLFTVSDAGQVIDGGSTSLTVTVKLQLAVAPTASVAVQGTVVG